jgi:hypothetical protein
MHGRLLYLSLIFILNKYNKYIFVTSFLSIGHHLLRRTLHLSVRCSSGLIPLIPSPDGEGTVLQIFNELHNYHINFSSLLTTFGDSD